MLYFPGDRLLRGREYFVGEKTDKNTMGLMDFLTA